MKKKKPIINKYILFFAILTGAMLAIFTDFGPIDWVYVLLFIPMTILTLQPTIIIHELGHLVLGFMTGYRFLSFRYLSWIIIKDKEGKFHFNRYSIIGTGGQCLMIPPDKDDIPIFWYNVGGVLFNTISIILAVLMMFWFSRTFIIYVLSVFIFMSVLLIALNWLPIKGITNDGNNYREAKKNTETKHAFYDILRISMYYYYGYRSNSIPLKSTPEHLSYDKILQAAILLFMHSRKLYALDIESFKQGINQMENAFQSNQLQMLPVLKLYVYFVRLLDRKLDDPIFCDKTLQSILKRSKYEPFFYIIRYVESTIRGHEDSNKIKTSFFQLAQKSHLQGEILDCIELLDYLDQHVLFPSFFE
jgi:hypothetical protein